MWARDHAPAVSEQKAFGLRSSPNLRVPQHNPLVAGQILHSHRATGGESLNLTQQVAFDVSNQMFIHLDVPRDGLALAGERIPVEVVSRTVAEQLAALSLQLPQEVTAFHTATSLTA